MQVRRAELADAADIATVHVRSWQGAYRGTFPDDYLDALAVHPRAEQWRRTIAAGVSVLVVEDADRVVGFSCVEASRDADADADVGEVFAIYLEPDAWGTGAGRALMTAALEALVEAGYREATLWVLDENARAQGFYRRLGWHDDGVTKDEVMAGTPIRERRFRIALGGRTPG